jgi:hypothetical protein
MASPVKTALAPAAIEAGPSTSTRTTDARSTVKSSPSIVSPSPAATVT